MSETILEMTKALVLAQIEAHYVTPDNLPEVLHRTYDALHQLQAMEADDTGSQGQEHSSGAGALDWKESISKRAIRCLECGDLFRQLSRRHLQKHGLDSRSYRLKYGIPSRQSLASRDATARRRQLAKSIRPWEKSRGRKPTPTRSARSRAKRTSD